MSHRILSPFERAKIGTVGKAIMVSEFLGLFIALASLIALFTVQTEEDLLLFGVIILIPGVFFVCVICWVLSAFNQMKNSTTQPNLKKAASLYLGVFVFSFISSFFSGFIELAIEVGIFILYPVDIVINAITCVIYYLVWKEFYTFFSEYKQNNTPADMANFDSIISLSKWLQIFVLIDIIPIVNIFSSIITSILTITWGLKVQREFPPSAFGYMGPQGYQGYSQPGVYGGQMGQPPMGAGYPQGYPQGYQQNYRQNYPQSPASGYPQGYSGAYPNTYQQQGGYPQDPRSFNTMNTVRPTENQPKTCPICATVNDASAVFCRNCGRNFMGP